MRGTPKYINHGINDLSVMPVVIEQSEYGQHLSKWFIKAERGLYHPQEMTASEALNYYGAETFSQSGKFFNHQTMFAKKAMANSKVVLQRIDLGGTSADVMHYIDIVDDVKTLKKRTPFGLVDNTAGDMTADVDTYKIRHIAIPGGLNEIQDGTMVDANGDPSTMYPIMRLQGGIGEYYNGIGYSIRQKAGIGVEELYGLGQHLYDLQLKLETNGVVKTIKTLVGSQSVKCGLVTGTDPVTLSGVGIADVLPESYYNEVDPLTEWRYTDVTVEVFEETIKFLAKKIAVKEAAYVNDHIADIMDTEGDPLILPELFDVNGTPEDYEKYSMLLNLTSFKSSNDVPYFTVYSDDTSVAPAGYQVGNEDTVFYLGNGTDVGLPSVEEQAEMDAPLLPKSFDDILDDRYHNQIISIMDLYLDKNSEYQEIALNPESVIYDSGFPMSVKPALCNIIGLRSDTSVVLSTYICNRDGNNVLPPEDEIAIGLILKNRLLLAPESVYFGTDVCRAVIFGGSCVAATSDYKGRIPTTYDFLAKAGSYMGAASQQWIASNSFDAGEESAAIEIKDILPRYVPSSIKDKLWAIGINWLEPLYNKKIYHWTAFATVASDRSTLNSVFTMFAACWITKKEILAWKIFSGETRLTPAIFKTNVESYMVDELRGAFDERFPLRPTVTFDSIDLKTGYSWHLDTRIGTNNMYTVVRNSVTVTRLRDF